MAQHEPEPLARGARLFDAGEFFAAHEAWEDRWREATDPQERRLLQGLIQVAAGFHKLVVQGKPDSAGRLLARGLAKLDGVADAEGIDLAGLREGTRAWVRALAEGNAEGRTIPAIGRRVSRS